MAIGNNLGKFLFMENECLCGGEEFIVNPWFIRVWHLDVHSVFQ